MIFLNFLIDLVARLVVVKRGFTYFLLQFNNIIQYNILILIYMYHVTFACHTFDNEVKDFT